MVDRRDTVIVIGLGNPGFEYEDTRHNIGFMVVEALSIRLDAIWKPGKGNYLIARTTLDGRMVILQKPLTYMNNSGEAVIDILERYPTPLQNVLAIVDDFAIPAGTIRVRAKGSDGGHNGLYSLIYHLNSDEFPRIRCGIKRDVVPLKRAMADFVLSPFEGDEKPAIEKMIVSAADAIEEFVCSGIDLTMTRFNTQNT